ncbi:unnamed protein product, partial [marine sediment metagenome]
MPKKKVVKLKEEHNADTAVFVEGEGLSDLGFWGEN